jgi:hypothetical protein
MTTFAVSKVALEPTGRSVAADCDGGRKAIILDGPLACGRRVHDMDRLDGSAPR